MKPSALHLLDDTVGEHHTNRNAMAPDDDRDKLLEQEMFITRALAGQVPKEEWAEIEKQRQHEQEIRLKHRRGELPPKCEKCDRDLKSEEPVWKYYEFVRPDRWGMRHGYTIRRAGHGVTSITVCLDCRPELFKLWQDVQADVDRHGAKSRYWALVFDDDKPITKPCEGCAREVTVDGALARRYKYWYCCWACETTANKSRKKAEGDDRRRRECAECGEVFTPARDDAKTCSRPCRQKAYRRRKALSRSREGLGSPARTS